MAKRRPWDRYCTPDKATQHLLNHFGYISGSVLEPCNGNGDISSALLNYSHLNHLVTNDADQSVKADYHLDASLPESWELNLMGKDYLGEYEWVVTNPPFTLAMEILKLAYEHTSCGVSMLLRLSFLEPTTTRATWLEKHPPKQVIVLPRISFSGDGNTDSVTCAWMTWTHHHYLFTPIVIVPPDSGDDFDSLSVD